MPDDLVSRLATHHEDAVPGDGAQVRGLDTGPLRMLSAHPVSKHDVEAADGDLGGLGAVNQPLGGHWGWMMTHPAPQTGHWTQSYWVDTKENLHFAMANANIDSLNNDLICCEPWIY